MFLQNFINFFVGIDWKCLWMGWVAVAVGWYGDAGGKAQVRELGRGQGNFKLAANFGYNSRGSADPRESLRKRRILKLALTAHKVLLANSAIGFLAAYWL